MNEIITLTGFKLLFIVLISVFVGFLAYHIMILISRDMEEKQIDCKTIYFLRLFIKIIILVLIVYIGYSILENQK